MIKIEDETPFTKCTDEQKEWAKQYDKECRERAEYLSGTEEKGVTLAPLSVTPEPIFHTDITADPLHWKNAHQALFYGKDWVKLSNK